MIRIFFIIVIILIIYNNFQSENKVKFIRVTQQNELITPPSYPTPHLDTTALRQQRNIIIKENMTDNNEIIKDIIPPWTRIENGNYYIKVAIPSLNDYENWKKIISNLDFIPTTSEIVINSENETHALVIANLLINNFNGNITFKEILDNDLLNLSINKVKLNPELIENIRNNIINKDNIKTIPHVVNNIEPIIQKEITHTNEYEAYNGNYNENELKVDDNLLEAFIGSNEFSFI